MKKTTTLLIDDIDGSEAESTVFFSFDGVSYEIDLSAEHTQEFTDAINEWISHARRSATRGAKRARRGTTSPSDAGLIRAWAHEQGIAVSDRGRIPAEIAERYRAANS